MNKEGIGCLASEGIHIQDVTRYITTIPNTLNGGVSIMSNMSMDARTIGNHATITGSVTPISTLRGYEDHNRNLLAQRFPVESDSNSINLNEFGKKIVEVNRMNGFYDRPVTFAERIALMHSELSEALEADRKDLMDDKLPHRKGIEVELADCLIRILDCASVMGMDIHGAVMEKLEVNKTRGYRHGGKKY